ncbi:hypothetical protein B0O99DRAFT_685444 [Bisporella sp. PMI_857]|nr:hypothetical protein B0O99DRAFT_685444 [Bisporella sp. PMI_857]
MPLFASRLYPANYCQCAPCWLLQKGGNSRRRHLSFAVILLTSFWWYTTSDHGTISNLLTTLRNATKTHGSTPAAAGTFAITSKVAAIVETRPLRDLIPLITHFAAVLGPSWPVLFFTRASTVQALAAFGHGSQPFKRMVQSGQVQIIELPSHVTLETYEGVSGFLASHWFWDSLSPAEHLLLFQTDSIICANSGRRVEDFFQSHEWRLSLRNILLSKEVINKFNIADDVGKGTDLGLLEDVWFWDRMKGFNARFPTAEKAGEFAVDFIWAELPLGYHGVNKTYVDRMGEVLKWCPEAGLASASSELLVLTEDEQAGWAVIEDGETEGGKFLEFGTG